MAVSALRELAPHMNVEIVACVFAGAGRRPKVLWLVTSAIIPHYQQTTTSVTQITIGSQYPDAK